MKQFATIYLMFLNILPVFAAPRDDTDTGSGLGGALLFFAIFIIWGIAELKNQDKNKKD